MRNRKRRWARSRNAREEGGEDQRDVREDEEDQDHHRALHKTVGVQTDSQHVGPEVGPGGDDASEDGEVGDAPGTGESAPSGLEEKPVGEVSDEEASFTV